MSKTINNPYKTPKSNVIYDHDTKRRFIKGLTQDLTILFWVLFSVSMFILGLTIGILC
jgi:hypothetical protein